MEQLQQLCAAACGTGLSTSKRHARTNTLYHGGGGRVVEGESLEPPPLYNEPGAPESAVFSIGSMEMKRRRLDSPKLESSTSESTVPPSLKAMRALFDHSFASFKQELKLELRQELRQDFEDILAAHKQDVAEMLQQTEARIVSMVRSEFGGHWMEMEQPMTYRVPEEMAETREEIMENITEQQLTATLNFTHHPLY